MKPKWGKKSLMGLVALMLFLSASVAFGEDNLGFSGRMLSEGEMSEARGGVSLPGGQFMYFSLDYVRLDMIMDNDSKGLGTIGSFNGLSQEVSIGKDGIKVGMDVIQSFLRPSNAAGSNGSSSEAGALASNDLSGSALGSGSMNTIIDATNPAQINSMLVGGNAFSNFHGISNANLIVGDNNVASIINVFNINLGFFNRENMGSFNPLQFVMQ